MQKFPGCARRAKCAKRGAVHNTEGSCMAALSVCLGDMTVPHL